jgi:hypothetical protein
MIGWGNGVFRAIPQRWERDHDAVEAIVKVLTEFLFVDKSF